MTRMQPHSDSTVYLMMTIIVIAIMYGKYLMGRGDKKKEE